MWLDIFKSSCVLDTPPHQTLIAVSCLPETLPKITHLLGKQSGLLWMELYRSGTNCKILCFEPWGWDLQDSLPLDYLHPPRASCKRGGQGLGNSSLPSFSKLAQGRRREFLFESCIYLGPFLPLIIVESSRSPKRWRAKVGRNRRAPGQAKLSSCLHTVKGEKDRIHSQDDHGEGTAYPSWIQELWRP